MKARVADLMDLKAAIAWHFRDTVVRCWCTEEIKMRSFDNAGADVWLLLRIFTMIVMDTPAPLSPAIIPNSFS
jgi:hypothetical protein